MRIAYIDKSFEPETLATIEQANEILDEFMGKGYTLTLRQLYYQFVARGLIPNNQKQYSRLGRIMNDARLAGMVDWLCLEDRTRNVQKLERFENIKEALIKAHNWYHVDMWKNQPFRPEVWVEKDALLGVISGVCERLDVPYISCRGFISQSEMWRAAQRMQKALAAFQTPYIIHLGDHDPSGVDASRDIKDRMSMFRCRGARFRRIALNMNQIDRYSPPPNPAKLTDSRRAGYIERFGDQSWELDSLRPEVLVELIENEVNKLRDLGQWAEDEQRKAVAKERLAALAENWSE